MHPKARYFRVHFSKLFFFYNSAQPLPAAENDTPNGAYPNPEPNVQSVEERVAGAPPIAALEIRYDGDYLIPSDTRLKCPLIVPTAYKSILHTDNSVEYISTVIALVQRYIAYMKFVDA